MQTRFMDLLEMVALGGALALGAAACSGSDAEDAGDTAQDNGSGCPTATGCPTAACPTTSACPTGSGCPTEGPGAFTADFETNPDFFTLMAAPSNEGSVHGEMQIWYSSNIRTEVESGAPFIAPEGTVAIKRQTSAAGVVSFNVMVKLAAGSSPAGEDWLWEQRNASTTVTNSGALGFCVDCHLDYPDTDLLPGTNIR